MKDIRELNDRFAGILLGTAVGDSVGLPAEGMSRRRVEKIFRGRWRQRFVFGRGMTSDDTEHAFLVSQALLKHPDDAGRFRKSLAWKLRLWLLGIPAGVGFATLRSCLKLWLGFPPAKSGVFSAGNGPAMRSAIIGASYHNDANKIREYVKAATEITHRDPRAFTGALAVALIAAHAVSNGADKKPGLENVIGILKSAGPDDGEWNEILSKFSSGFEKDLPVTGFADSIGAVKGISGYMYRTVPVAVYAWLKHYGDFQTTLESVLNCGGDTDTAGAITGALAGAVCGASGIPGEWLGRICEFPRTVGVIREVAQRLAVQSREGGPFRSVTYLWPMLLPRNIFFLIFVLLHGFRRMFPPY
ncbi:MAG: ADP-ribosylglycohydrolase family protein [Planctomycetota bacterium]|jgi:ADP-ribosylglycohydrolase